MIYLSIAYGTVLGYIDLLSIIWNDEDMTMTFE